MKILKKNEKSKKDKSKKRGSVAVLLVCIFVSLMLAVGSIGEAALRSAAVSVSECAVENACRSVLAGYDKALKDRYGLFGFEYDESKMADMIGKLTEAETASFRLTKCSVEEVKTEKSGYCLNDTETFLGQIKDIMKYRVFTDSIDSFYSMFRSGKSAISMLSNSDKRKKSLEESLEKAEKEAKESEDTEDDSSFLKIESVHRLLKNVRKRADNDIENNDEENDNILKNGKIIGPLPSVSAGCKANRAFSGTVSAISKITGFQTAGSISEEIYIDEYIRCFFTEYTDEKSDDSFFNNEIEYILYGDYSDSENYKRARRTLYLLRTAMNMAYIYSDSSKAAETQAVSQSITPGPFAALTQILIIAAWSAAEASNDIKNLEAGNRIPFVKTADTWKVSIDSIISGSFSGSMIKNDSSSGLEYERYLELLLLTEKTETKVRRMMDLIQINLKGTERSDFILGNLFCGFVADVKLQKKSIYSGIGNGTFSVKLLNKY